MSNLAQRQAEHSQATALAVAHVQAYGARYTPKKAFAGLEGVQADALKVFETRGFPTTRDEKWCFTNLAPLARQTFVPPQSRPINSSFVAESRLMKGAVALVFIDGTLHHDFSDLTHLPEGVTIAPLSQAVGLLNETQKAKLTSDDDALEAVNTAFLTDGYVLTVAQGVQVAAPIELMFISTDGNSANHSRHFITLEENSKLELYETWVSTQGAEATWQNNVTHVDLQEGACLNLNRLQNESNAGFYTSTIKATLAKDARFEGFVVNLGSKLARTHIKTQLLGTGSHVVLNGFSLTSKGQHHNITTTTSHKTDHTSAEQLFRNVVAADANKGGHGVFMGQYLVAPEAQQTDANMLNQNLLLGPKAKVDYKPELEIFADDVKCSHGATTGRLDEEALFYVESRGVARPEAEQILTQAFIDGVLEKVQNNQARKSLALHTKAWFKQQNGGAA